jgi:hypothetical protein
VNWHEPCLCVEPLFLTYPNREITMRIGIGLGTLILIILIVVFLF